MTKRSQNKAPVAAKRVSDVRVVVAVPMERTIPSDAALSLMYVARRGWQFFGRGYGRCDIHRNEFAKMLLDSPFTHLVMLDSDHIHPSDVVERLARHVVDDPKKLVVGGLNFRRTPPYDPCAFFQADDGRMYTRVDMPATGLMEVDVIGHGCILISREVFERVPAPWWTYEYPDCSDVKAQWKFASDDMYFCRLMREHGIQMWCDMSLTSPHLGQLYIGRDTYAAWLKAHPEMLEVVKLRDHVEVGNAEIHRTGDVPAGDTGAQPDGRGSGADGPEGAAGIGAV